MREFEEFMKIQKIHLSITFYWVQIELDAQRYKQSKSFNRLGKAP